VYLYKVLFCNIFLLHVTGSSGTTDIQRETNNEMSAGHWAKKTRVPENVLIWVICIARTHDSITIFGGRKNCMKSTSKSRLTDSMS
jgi:hypothetical protein